MFISMMGFGVIIPLLPIYDQSLGASGLELGLIAAGFSISHATFLIFTGRLSDRFGRKAMGSAYGVLIFFATGLGGSVGPLLGGYIYDATGAFDLGWQICMVALVIVALAILALKSNASANGRVASR